MTLQVKLNFFLLKSFIYVETTMAPAPMKYPDTRLSKVAKTYCTHPQYQALHKKYRSLRGKLAQERRSRKSTHRVLMWAMESVVEGVMESVIEGVRNGNIVTPQGNDAPQGPEPPSVDVAAAVVADELVAAPTPPVEEEEDALLMESEGEEEITQNDNIDDDAFDDAFLLEMSEEEEKNEEESED